LCFDWKRALETVLIFLFACQCEELEIQDLKLTLTLLKKKPTYYDNIEVLIPWYCVIGKHHN
jgi:hypothetical protein